MTVCSLLGQNSFWTKTAWECISIMCVVHPVSYHNSKLTKQWHLDIHTSDAVGTLPMLWASETCQKGTAMCIAEFKLINEKPRYHFQHSMTRLFLNLG
jgi:hypothetical protein